MGAERTIETIEKPQEETGASVVTELTVTGMTCGNCARHVTEAIQSVPGVRSVLVSLAGHTAAVRWTPGKENNVAAVVRAVEQAGYGAKVFESHVHSPVRKLTGWQVNLWIGVCGTSLLMLGEWVLGLGLSRWFQWISFAIASVVQVLAGAPFYRGAWNQLKAKSANMDTLVALGSTTAYAYSTWALLGGAGDHLYFMEAAAIITLVSIGHWLESRVGARASSTLHNLLNLAPQRARKRNAGGVETEVPISELRVGELIVLRPGDRVPTDGQAIEGDSTVDESMLTGESAPVDKTEGSLLYGGTVNLNGHLLMRVTATGEETALAQVIAAVQRAQTSRANIQRLGDRVSSVFVPVVILVALAAGLWWGLAPGSAREVHAWLAKFLWPAHPAAGAIGAAFITAAAVLIVACPCAMGLATPAAIMAGSNAAAERGILIRDGVALEKAGKVTAVLFDKTGTLTIGKPSVVKIWTKGLDDGSNETSAKSLTPPLSLPASTEPSEGEKEKETSAMRLAAALAQHSSHPVSQAIAKVARPQGELHKWEEIRGAGVKATIQIRGAEFAGQQAEVTGQTGKISARSPAASARVAKLGSLRWLRENGVQMEEGKEFIEQWSARGATIAGVAVEKSLLGLFAVQDTLKAGARQVIAQLQAQGFKTYLVTGDHALTANAVARQAGLNDTDVFSEVPPEQKAEFVEKLQRKGERVAFVGDGINDAPALEQADLGIAVSRASDIAREAADIILLNSEIGAVPEALALARATLRTIKQNLFWAFFYNALGVPLAALGFMSPILCAAAMGLSDLVVIGNALRLRGWKQ